MTERTLRILPPTTKNNSVLSFDELDVLGRHDLGKGLKALIEATDEPMVVLLDGAWGSGKTYFLKQFSNLIEEEGFVVYFDAFQHDHTASPLAAIMAEFHRQSKSGLSNAAMPLVKNVLFGAGQVVGRTLLRVGAAALSGGLVSPGSVADVAQAAIDTAGGVAEDLFTKQIETISESSECIEALKERLTDLVESLPRSGKRRIVFIVDELDRCRPLFALECLELLKHTMKVDGVKFIVGANLTELKKTVCHAYGQNFDADDYLHKFIDIRVSLPKFVAHNHSDRPASGAVYLNFLWREMGFESINIGGKQIDYSQVERLIVLAGLELRHIERLLSRLSICLQQADLNYLWEFNVLTELCFLDLFRHALFEQLISGRASYSAVQEALSLNSGVKGLNGNEISGKSLNHWKVFLASPNTNFPDGSPLQAIHNHFAIERDMSPQDFIPYLARKYITPSATFRTR